MSEMKYQAIKYIRLSYTDDKESESNSAANQRKLLDAFIADNPDIEAVGEKVDDGFSGVLFERPAFKEMMDAIKDGSVNCVIVKDLSRLGREYIQTGRYLQDIFPAYGVRFIAIGDNVDTAKQSAGDDIIVTVKNIVNDAYARDISVKTRSALEAKRADGDYVGACPIYGYAKSEENKNLLVVDEYPASIVREIYRMKIGGMSAAKIADELNSQGVLSPLSYKKNRGLPHPKKGFADRPDAKWSPIAVIRVLRDETYTGTLLQGKQGKPSFKVKEVVEKPREEWARTENAHESIVSKNDFELVQRLLRLDTRSAPGEKEVSLFSGILICGHCGERMTRKTVPYKDTAYHYYYCRTGKKRGCLGAAMIKESDLIACALDCVKAHVGTIASLNDLILASAAARAESVIVRRYEAQISENGKQLEKTNERRAGLHDFLTDGTLTKENYKTLKARYDEQAMELQEAIATLRSELDGLLSGKNERLQWMERFREFENITALDRRTVACLIHSICVKGKTDLQVTFNYQPEFERIAALIGREAA